MGPGFWQLTQALEQIHESQLSYSQGGIKGKAKREKGVYGVYKVKLPYNRNNKSFLELFFFIYHVCQFQLIFFFFPVVKRRKTNADVSASSRNVVVFLRFLRRRDNGVSMPAATSSASNAFSALVASRALLFLSLCRSFFRSS